MATPINIGILLYPNVTQLDATGPAQVLSRVPGATMHMIWKTRDPVPTDALGAEDPAVTRIDEQLQVHRLRTREVAGVAAGMGVEGEDVVTRGSQAAFVGARHRNGQVEHPHDGRAVGGDPS